MRMTDEKKRIIKAQLVLHVIHKDYPQISIALRTMNYFEYIVSGCTHGSTCYGIQSRCIVRYYIRKIQEDI